MDEADRSLVRMVDANLNRAGEGLRVIEDVARFYLNDTRLALRLKAVRHRLRSLWRDRPDELLGSRDAAADGLRQGLTGDEGNREDLAGLLTANFKRVAEAVRVLEETASLLEGEPAPDVYKDIRFRLYDLEGECYQLLRLKAEATEAVKKFDPRLIAIVDIEIIGSHGHDPLVRKLADGGATSIQLRDKTADFKALFRAAGELLSATRARGLSLVINDRVDLAWSVGSDGVHVGSSDMPVHLARKLLGAKAVIGLSVSDPRAASEASASGADYLGTGAITRSPTESGYPVVGMDGLRRVAESVELPVVAVGGVKPEMVRDILDTGAAGIAVSSGLFGGDDIEAAAGRYRHEIDTFYGKKEAD